MCLFETLTSIIRTGLPILVELIDLVNFPTRIPDCDSHSPALLDLSLSAEARICSTMAFPPLGNSRHVFVSVSIDFWSKPKRNIFFHWVACDYSYTN